MGIRHLHPKGRPRRPEGTTSDLWWRRIQKLEDDYDLDDKQLGLLLGYSRSTISVYRSSNVKRNPPEAFKDKFIALEKELATAPEGVLITLDGRHAAIKGLGQRWQTVWLSAEWALHRCEGCGVLYVGQWNSRRCPNCQGH